MNVRKNWTYRGMRGDILQIIIPRVNNDFPLFDKIFNHEAVLEQYYCEEIINKILIRGQNET